MPSYDLRSTTPADRRRVYRRSRLFAVIVLLALATNVGWNSGVASGRLVDTDAYSWLNRVVDLQQDGTWFDDTIERSGPPDGHTQHWSRPFDVLLLVGAGFASLFVPFVDALFAWALILPLALGALAIWFLWWSYADMLDSAGLEALAVLAGASPVIAAGFALGRSDHQALVGVLLIVVAGSARQALLSGTNKAVFACGIASALGLWVGTEFLLVIAVTMLVFAISWVRGRDQALTNLSKYSFTLAIGAATALLLENGLPDALRVPFDELSVPPILFSAYVGCTAKLIAQRNVTNIFTVRTLVALGTAVLGVVAVVACYPQLRAGPLGPVDPLYLQTRLSRIGEIQPMIVRGNVALSAQSVASNLSLLPFAVIGFVSARRKRTEGLLPLALLTLLYLPLAVAQVRWAFPLNLLLVVPAARGVQYLMHRAFPHARRVHLGMMTVVLAAALWWVPVAVLLSAESPARCDLNDVIPTLSRADEIGRTRQLVMAFTDYGPELLFRTPHSVLSIPNHRPQQGYRTTFDVMTATSADTAREILRTRGVDLVLVCTDTVESSFYGDGPDSFHRRLTTSTPPAWLREVPLPERETPPFRLYEVR